MSSSTVKNEATPSSSHSAPAPPATKKPNSSCRSCARLVQEILQNPHSRPRQVLQSLIEGMTSGSHPQAKGEQPSISWKPVDDGVQVEMRVPEKPYEEPQKWMRVAPQESLPHNKQNHHNSQQPERPTIETTFSRPTLPVLATSSAATATSNPSVVAQPPPKDDPQTYITETIKIECRPCDTVGPEQGARALIMGPNPLSIVACTNRLVPGDKNELSEVLVHELLHAYDVKRLNLDFQDCESMAYSEVRAAREAECHSPAAAWQQGPSFLKEYCVKQKAIAATHNLFPSRGRQCVRAVFSTAYQDVRPFVDPTQLRQYVSKTYVPSNQQHNSKSNNNPQASNR